jgi:hypothetical protein
LAALASGFDPEETLGPASEDGRTGTVRLDKVDKHFDRDIGERYFTFTRKPRAIEAEAALFS